MPHELILPKRLTRLIEDGHWRVVDPAKCFEGEQAKLPRRLVDSVFPGENLFNCCSPPFSTAESDASVVESIYEAVTGQSLAKSNQIDWAKTLLIADFEIGSESSVILDYTEDLGDPSVKWFDWGAPGWVTACKNFDELADRLELDQLIFPQKIAPLWRRLLG